MSEEERKEFVKASQRLREQIVEADLPQELAQQCFTEVIDEEILQDLRVATDRESQGEGRS